MIEIKEATEKYANAWNAVVYQSNDGNINSLFEWRSLCQRLGFKPIYLIAEENSNLLGVMPACYDRRFLSEIAMSPPPLFVDYGGPCLINLPEKEKIKVSNGLISTFDQLARNCGASISNISSMATDQSLHSLLADLGFKVAERDYTLIVSLKEDLNYAWNYLIAGNARKAIRKAIKSGVVVDRQESSSALPDFYELYVDSMKRLGVLPCPYSIAKDMWRLMGSSNCMKVFFAKIKNECIAGVLFFTFRNSIIGYLSVSSKKYLKLQPNNLLYYEIIKYGYENNFPFIDYGAAQPNTGSFEFKKSMGGRPREIYSFKKVYSGSKLHLKYILQFPRTLITTAFNKYIFPTAFSKRLDEDTWRLFS